MSAAVTSKKGFSEFTREKPFLLVTIGRMPASEQERRDCEHAALMVENHLPTFSRCITNLQMGFPSL